MNESHAPASRLRGLAAPAAVMAVVAAATAYVGSNDPNQPGHYPPCPLLQLTGVFCPGCGGLRATHALAHGDLLTALGANAMAVGGFLIFVLGWLWWCARVVRARPLTVPVRPAQLWMLVGLLVVFTVVRNLPFGSALTP